jgi:hypothetical protein
VKRIKLTNTPRLAAMWVLLAVALGLAGTLQAQPERAADDPTDTVRLQVGDRSWAIPRNIWEEKLLPVVVRELSDNPDQEVSVPSPTPAEVQPAGQPAAEPPQTWGEWLKAWMLRQWQEPWVKAVVIMSGLMTLVVGAVVYHFRMRVPRRRRKPLIDALAIIEEDRPDQFGEAERLLVEALTAGMDQKSVADARFALAYVRARLNRLSEAEGVLADLKETGGSDESAIYLEMWIKCRQKDYERVEEIYAEHGDRLRAMLQTNLMIGIAWLVRGRKHWVNREVQGAMHYFDNLLRLGVLTDQIPAQFDDHQVVLGIQALFQNNVLEATQMFEGALNSAKANSGSTIKPRLGLLLCKWRQAEYGSVDKELGKLAKEISAGLEQQDQWGETICTHADCHARHRARRASAGQQASCSACSRSFKVEIVAGNESLATVAADETEAAATATSGAPRANALPVAFDETELLLRNVLLWRAMALLALWRFLPEKSGLPAGQLEKLCERTQAALARDARFADPYLIEGLVRYYFARNEQERAAGMKLIEESRECTAGVSLPQVLNLCEREKRRIALIANSVQHYLGMVKQYLTNEAVPERLRVGLQNRLGRFARFAAVNELDLPVGSVDLSPSTDAMQARSQVTIGRVMALLGQLPAQDEALVASVDEYNRETAALHQHAQKFQEVEMELLGVTGEVLLGEEAGVAELGAAAAGGEDNHPDTP